ncbi:MAG: tRNA pseudouridine(55) synthase TruB [Gammaproteobacteria bacterium]|nr:tRNA pseudouridine(55) synthase TruB [Gammaproteobacteria bacterium]
MRWLSVNQRTDLFVPRRRKGRDIDGILLLDKPEGISSNHALRRVSRLLNARKGGHTGSLDPLATGLLVLCFGRATRISEWLLGAEKTYLTTARLGITTATGDREGETLSERPVPDLSETQIESVLEDFRGEQQQIPPMYSALKHEGRRLYEMAREGVEIERPPRDIIIHALRLEEFGDNTLSLFVRCSKGTYIRTLVSDIGERLGCGAHVDTLRRVSLGPFEYPQMMELAALEELATREGVSAVEELLQPIDAGLAGWPSVTIAANTVERFCQGQVVATDSVDAGALVRVHDEQGELLGMGEIQQELCVSPRRLLVQRSRQG